MRNAEHGILQRGWVENMPRIDRVIDVINELLADGDLADRVHGMEARLEALEGRLPRLSEEPQDQVPEAKDYPCEKCGKMGYFYRPCECLK